MKIELVQGNAKKMGRSLRKPKHSFFITQAAWAMTPFMCHPVWPGETVKSLSYIAKMRSQAINTLHPIMGWWHEVFFYYVKHRDLKSRDTLTQFHVEGVPLDDLISAPDPKHYYKGYGVNWAKLCMECIAQSDFRQKEEDVNSSLIDGYYGAPLNIKNWMDSLTLANTGDPDQGELLGQYTTLDADVDPQYQERYDHWERMTAAGLTTATFDDYLKSFGVKTDRVVKEDLHVPELMKYQKVFAYPKWDTQVDAYSMIADVACSMEKDMFIREPGFIVGFTVLRPKVYATRQTGAAIELMNTPETWLPAVLWDQPYTSLRVMDNSESPLEPMDGVTWVDIRDIAVHGDQYLNFPPVLLEQLQNGYSVGVPIPQPNTNRRYPTQADADRMFTSRSVLGGHLDTDGLVSMQIASFIKDTTPGVAMGVHQLPPTNPGDF